ncbi:MAG: hypothetical protein DRJ65_10345 [Acidobacteria bacterium]|nr:MAG: hypothetical protein DRJ65_10345 [Acidobacteriota bacterium]
MHKPAIVTWKNAEFDSSRELRFADQHFNRKVRDYPVALSAAGANQTINALIDAFPWLSHHPIWIVARSPAMLWQPQRITQFVSNVIDNPARWIGIAPEPADVLPEGASDFPYFTWRGYCRFAEHGASEEQAFSPHDRENHALLAVAHSRVSETLHDCPILELPGLAPDDRSTMDLKMYVHPLDGYYKHQRDDVLAELPQSMESLLDIGCGFGAFGQAVKQRFRCRVVGVELNPIAAAIAEQSLDRVIEGDVLDTDIGESFDVITLNDVLEHVEDSDLLLRALVHRGIKPDGRLILSVPNIGHWSIVDDLIAGRWDYLPAGVLCTDHVRFFTRRGIHSLLRNNGWTPVKTTVIPGPYPPGTERRFSALKKSGFDVDTESLNAQGFIITAQPTTPADPVETSTE